MRKITINRYTPPEREVVAVIGAGGGGLYVKDTQGNIRYFQTNGKVSHVASDLTFDELLVKTSGRKPIYVGDTVTIQF